MKRTVYRIENVDGHGMYRCGRGLCTVAYSLGHTLLQDTRHPMPCEDSQLVAAGFIDYDRRDMIYGFASIEQLRSWLYRDEWLSGLARAGHYLIEMEVEEYYIGSTQAAFVRTEEYVRHDINTYFKLN